MAVFFPRIQLVGFVGLVIASVIGGIAYHFLELDNENLNRNIAAEQLNEFLATRSCVNLTQIQAVSNLVKLAEISGVRIGLSTQPNAIIENSTNWDIQSSIFLSFQAVGGIYIGSLGPVTEGGKAFMVFFILLGIPLFYATAFGTGDILANWTDLIRLAIYRRVLKREGPVKTTTYASICNTIALFAVGFPLFVIIPSVVFYVLENWTYGEALYSTLLTTFTIGFTDLFPGTDAPASYRGVYRVLVGIWLIVDLFWFAGFLKSLSDLLRLDEQRAMPVDEAIREENEMGKDGQRKIKVKKNWKKKHFDPHFQQHQQQQRPVSAISPGLALHFDVVPAYDSARQYPPVEDSAVDSRLAILTPISSAGNVTRLVVGTH